MVTFINFDSNFVFRKVIVNFVVFNTIQYWVRIIFPSNAIFNVLMISWSSQVNLSGSYPNIFLNSKSFFDVTPRLLIFLSTKLLCTNTLHCWNSVSGVNCCLYFCLSGQYLSKICAQFLYSDSISKSLLFNQKYLPLSWISASHFYMLIYWFHSLLYIHIKKFFF